MGMGRLPEPDDVDIIVDGRDADPESLRETVEYIKQYKQRPEYAEEAREARKVLESLRINSKDRGILDPDALLEHWKRCAADLAKDDRNGDANGESP